MKVTKTYSWDKMIGAVKPRIAEMLNDIADTINADIRTGIEKRKDIDNTPTKPLKAATIKQKQRKGSARPDLPRVDTGIMSGVLGSGGANVKQRATKTNLKAIILPPSTRAPYLKYQQAVRPWFGIAKRTEPKVDKIMKTKGRQIVVSARGG